MDAAFSSSIACAENISLLYLLHSVPSPPIRSPINAQQTPKAGYSLPFDKERSLASTLAFLCSIRDDPNRIPAVCIEEDPDSAVKVKESNVFDNVVSMCSERLISRLRFRPNRRNKTKQPFAEVLHRAIDSLGHAKSKSPEVEKAFRNQARNVIKLADGWTKYQTEARLSKLVEGIHLLWRVDGLHDLLRSIPNNLMDPSSRDSLWNIITKVARYREAAGLLYRRAKQFLVVRQAKVVSVNLPENAFVRVPRSGYTPSLQSTLARINSQNDMPQDSERIVHILGIQQKDAERSFAQQTRRTMEEAKIHAEVQLEWHCQTRNLKRPPRVICSSKDACFLCDKFIATTGKLHIPKSHGRLYPGWRLPIVLASDDKTRQFNAVLEETIRQSIRALLVSRKKTLYPDPQESTILTLQRSTSTLASSTPSDIASGEPESSPFDSTDKPADIGPCSGSGESTAVTPHHLHPPFGDVEGGLADITQDHRSGSNSFLLQSETQRSSQHGGPEAHNIRHALSDNQSVAGIIEDGHMTPLYKTDTLTLQIEYSVHASEERERESRQLKYEVEYLSAGDAERARPQSQYPVIVAEKGDYTCSYPITESRLFYICYRGKILKVKLKGKVA
ncbi:hypothetical protein BKA56DRAFT_599587 [Ilyonectria sp. MPI-CAGE-AT-0026]|nr:hypothetical protein BKA56DRAFT_599587 [Ilyonectria sp. MPI-CAGE-AT-0026]